MRLFWQTCFVLSVLLELTACYEAAPPPPTATPVTEGTNAKSASIGRSGGKVTTTAANGVTYTLIVPPEALKETVSITLTPISSMGKAPLSAGVTAAAASRTILPVRFESGGIPVLQLGHYGTVSGTSFA